MGVHQNVNYWTSIPPTVFWEKIIKKKNNKDKEKIMLGTSLHVSFLV